MISYNSDYFTTATAPVKTVRIRFVDQDAEDVISFQSGDNLMTATMTAIGSFLGSGTKKFVAKCIDDYRAVDGHVYHVYMGMYNPNDSSWDEVQLGEFTVTKVEFDEDKNSSIIEMFDGLGIAALRPYVLPDDMFPCTVEELAAAVADTLNVQLDPGFSSLPNADYEITQNLWALINNTTLRDVIFEIAQATGTTAITRGNTLLFRQFNIESEIMTTANLKTFKIGDNWGVLNSLVLAREPQQDNILLQDDEDIDDNGLTQFKIVNNQILDDDRQALIQPIYDSIVSTTPFITFDGVDLTTEGHGWYEIGDSFTVSVPSGDYTPFITEINLTIDGGVKEVLRSVIPDMTKINQQTAGGILKSIYNTEIITDKQNQEIISVVERLDTLDDTVANNYTQIIQQIDNITTTVQTTGGGNVIKNSVGYAKGNGGTIDQWEEAGTGTVSSQNSTESLIYGAISGNQITLSGTSKTLTQRVTVSPTATYSVSFYAKKNASGAAIISLTNSVDNYSIELPDGSPYVWAEFSLENLEPHDIYFDVTIESDSAIGFSITDLMLNAGTVKQIWQQAPSEILTTQVKIDDEGITVRSSVYTDSYSTMTPLEFATYDSEGVRNFGASNDQVLANNLVVDGYIDTKTVRVIQIESGSRAGMAFVIKDNS